MAGQDSQRVRSYRASTIGAGTVPVVSSVTGTPNASVVEVRGTNGTTMVVTAVDGEDKVTVSMHGVRGGVQSSFEVARSSVRDITHQLGQLGVGYE